MLDPLYEGMAWLLAAFYSLTPDLGVSIILLTIAVMLVLYPLTAKASRSMIAMQRIAPEVKKLQAKHKGDRQKLNEETMKLYQANRINPLGGCLPLVLQFPVFISLFQVLRNTWKFVPVDSRLFHDLCGDLTRQACEAADPTHLGFISPDFLDLSKSATDSHGDIISALPYWALVVAVIVVGYLQVRRAQLRTPSVNRQMAMILRFLPVGFGLISVGFPSGVVLYWFVSSLWRFGQQEVIFRHYGSATTTGTREHRHRVRPAAPVETTGRERGGGDDDRASREEPTPARPTPPTSSGTGPARAERAEKGLRSFLQLPAPPGDNGGNRETRPGPAPGASSSSGSGSGSAGGPHSPQPARRRRNRKKRKR